ncbi:diguanylate cyclase [Luteimonas sp. MC1828]|uniref:diguanylate cyclase domain-containing protein n=1 Tax=Luteimonas sp. MC1828 TaxID=2799787 RepID=UPI0018F152D9|nr:diguanylate cyclase [Luteimonas sp. MC1828]MBJ7574657.1 diguanylate cyclase [Luteimonas sp. MC1828]
MTGPGSTARGVAAATKSLATLEAHAALLRAEVAGLEAVLATLRDRVPLHNDSDLLEANGQLVLAALRAQLVAEAAERHRDEAARAGQRDPLTDLPNRASMRDRLPIALASAQRRRTHLAVLFIDIDRFKQINDTYGHSVGDGVLQCVARRLEASVRETDTVGRHGGEEFLVLLDDLASTDDVPRIVETLLDVLAEPESIAGHVVELSASIGVAFYPDDATDPAALIACADAAMYRAKRHGPGGYEFCHDVDRDADGAPIVHVGAASPPAERRLPGHAGTRARHEALQEANGLLVASALLAQAQQTLAVDAHARALGSMATAAHELRNPLTPIRLAAGMLGSARDDLVRFTRLRDIIEAEVVHIARLVDDLVDGSRVVSGKLRLECADTDLASVLETALLTCRPTIESRQQQLLVDLPPGDAMPLHADRTRLVQVFTNLLDNASKYTQEGGRISLAAARSPGALTVSVHDTGMGIPPGALPHIFDIFVQDPVAAALRPGGLGIGLAIVRELVESHGGTVEASSGGNGLGSTFVVTLPPGDEPARETANA